MTDKNQVFKMHEFFDKHTFESITIHIQGCKGCGYLTGNPYSSCYTEPVINYLLYPEIIDFLSKYSLGLSKESITMAINNRNRYKYFHNVDAWAFVLNNKPSDLIPTNKRDENFVKVLGSATLNKLHDAHTRMLICENAIPYFYNSDLMLNYCVSIGRPYMDLFQACHSRNKRPWYSKIIKPFYDSMLKQLDTRKRILWSKMQSMFTIGYGSPEYLKYELEHKQCLRQIEAIKRTKYNFKVMLGIKVKKHEQVRIV